MAQAASKTCEICDLALGECFCQQCCQIFCKRCKSSHLKSNISKNHTFQNRLNIKTDTGLLCTKHNELFLFHCLPCDSLVCKICAVEIHNGHAMSQLEKYIEGLKTEVKKTTEIKIKSLESNLGKLEKGICKYKQEVQTAVQAITDEGTQLKQTIDRKVCEIIRSLKEEESKQLKALMQIQTDLRLKVEDLRNYKQQVDTLQRDSVGVTFKEKLIQLKTELDIKKCPDLPGMPTASYLQKRTSDTSIKQLFGALSTTDMKKTMVVIEPNEKPDVEKATVGVDHKKKPDMKKTTVLSEPIEKSTGKKRKNLYDCLSCGIEQWSDKQPSNVKSGAFTYYGAILDCKKCGKSTFHYYQQDGKQSSDL